MRIQIRAGQKHADPDPKPWFLYKEFCLKGILSWTASQLTDEEICKGRFA